MVNTSEIFSEYSCSDESVFKFLEPLKKTIFNESQTALSRTKLTIEDGHQWRVGMSQSRREGRSFYFACPLHSPRLLADALMQSWTRRSSRFKNYLCQQVKVLISNSPARCEFIWIKWTASFPPVEISIYENLELRHIK